jgi:hypothetical protein
MYVGINRYYIFFQNKIVASLKLVLPLKKSSFVENPRID